MNISRIILFLLLLAFSLLADTIPMVTGIVVKDLDGNSFNIDSLLNAGKHIWVHQAHSK